MNYQARWEARSSGPRIVFAHCPYAMILPEHPELCQMDASLLESVLEVSVVQAARLAPSRQGGKCAYLRLARDSVQPTLRTIFWEISPSTV